MGGKGVEAFQIMPVSELLEDRNPSWNIEGDVSGA